MFLASSQLVGSTLCWVVKSYNESVYPEYTVPPAEQLKLAVILVIQEATVTAYFQYHQKNPKRSLRLVAKQKLGSSNLRKQEQWSG